jgi:glycosyltransferase involved in cell wall biosynthesis
VRVVILADTFFASRERELLARLEIGLADEGIRVIQASPSDRGAATTDASSVFRTSVTFPARGLPFTTGLRARRLAERLTEIEVGGEDGDIDIVHVFGGTLWPFAQLVAEACGADLVLEVWRAGLVERAAAFPATDTRTLTLAPDPAIDRALKAAGVSGRLASWGVHAGDPPKPKFQEGHAPTVILVGAGNDARGMRTALTGLADCARRHPDLLIFVDALAARRADLYPLAASLGITGNVSFIEEIETRRDLLVHADLLLLCEALGEQRTVVLDAMAHGMVVLSAEDRFSDCLRDGTTALLLKSPGAREWGSAVNAAISDVAGSRRLGETAREFVMKERRASDHVRAVLEAYSWLRREPAAVP